MKQLVSINLTTRTALNWRPPTLRQGESITLALRFFKTDAGEEIEVPFTIESFRAGIGVIDARPKGGEFSIKVGDGISGPSNTTQLISFDADASTIKKRLNSLETASQYGVATVSFADDSWLIFFGDQSEHVPLEVVQNGLWPLSRGRVHAWQSNGKWIHEIRLTQDPIAFTSSHEITLPPAPVVSRIQEGGSDAFMSWNEIQQLYIPPDFRGAYVLKRGYAKTSLLSREDGVDSIEEALQVLGANCFKVDLPLSNKPSIEFIGDYSGSPQELLELEVKQSPPGDLTFTLQLDRSALASALRKEDNLTLPIEIRMVATDENQFQNEIVALSLPINLERGLLFPDLEERPIIDWLRPASPKTYVPFGSGEFLTGNKYYAVPVGDGENDQHVVAHGLGTEAVFVVVRENISGGKLLVQGTDFSVTIDSENQVTVTSTITPALDGWVVMVIGAATVAAWANELTVTVPQVVAGGGYQSLPSFMDEFGSRVKALEDILPVTGPAAIPSQASGIRIELPQTKNILFFKSDIKTVFGNEGDSFGVNPERLPKGSPAMLPAVHNAEIVDPLPSPLPSATHETVWRAAALTLVPGFKGIRSSFVEENGYVGSDGRGLFVCDRGGTTNSYYPRAFQQELFRFFINEKQFALGRKLDVQFGLAFQLIHANSNAQWVLIIEHGTAPQQEEPAPLDINLENIVWNPTPLLTQRLILTPLLQTHSFGVRIAHEVSEITMDTMLYGVWSNATELAPTEPNFAIRARLAQFDTENYFEADARGWVTYQIIGVPSVGEESTSKPSAIIT